MSAQNLKMVLLIISVCFYFFVNGQNNATTSDLNKNWRVTKVFDGGGAVKGISKEYFDNQARPTQTQVRNMSSGQVIASQVIYDAMGRPVVSTLPAPINSGNFGFRSDFVLDANGNVYNYNNFDEAKTNNPDPLSATTPGTLGWFYSSNNTLESRTPESNFPYSRTDFYKDGTGSVKRSAGVGNAFKMGSGHEVSTYTTPVINELSHYLQVWAKFFPNGELGQIPSTYKFKATQTIVKDQNGREAIQIQDNNGRVLMKAYPGNDLIVNNVIQINNLPYKIVFPATGLNGCTLDNQLIKIIGSGQKFNITKGAYSTDYNGSGRSLPIYFNSYDFGSTISSDQPFIVQYDEECGVSESQTTISSQQAAPDHTQIAYLKLFSTNTALTVSGNHVFYNMDNETPQTFGAQTTNPGKGYYKILAQANNVNVSYQNGYTNISYYFYNQLGQLIATISPEGVKRLIQDLNAYNNFNDLPFTAINEYDLHGRLVATSNRDIGRTEYIYNRMGAIRFSQNEEQRSKGWFSYVNYNLEYKVIESGEYRPLGDITFNQLKTNYSIIEDYSLNGGLNVVSNKYQWIKISYSIPDNSHGFPRSQTYLKNSISFTETETSKTWFSYNDQNKITWCIKGIRDFGSVGNWGYKLTEYEYDNDGALTRIVYQNNQSDMFVQEYEYNISGQPYKVYTNLSNNPANRILQKKYIYDILGVLKREELATNVQGLDYTYTLQGRLKAINHSNLSNDPGFDNVSTNGFLPDAFGMTLEYYNGDYIRSGTNLSSININPNDGPEQFNGKIRGMSWFSKKPTSSNISMVPTMYVFKYDNYYQFLEAIWGDISGTTFMPFTNVNQEIVGSYDQNGNILNLTRTNSLGIITNNLNYIYFNASINKPGNQLLRTEAPYGGGIYAEYDYNLIGQLKSERGGSLYSSSQPTKYLEYDVKGKVIGVYKNSNFSLPILKFVYDHAGLRIKKLSYNNNGSLINTTYYSYDVYNRLMAVYEQANGGSPVLKEIPIYAGKRIGLYSPITNEYRYELADHLGNVRAVFIKNSFSNIDVVTFRDYYPFGSTIPGREHIVGDNYRYGYQGQYNEKDEESGWNAFELRMYDSKIGRWLTSDPANQFSSPYLGMGNDPVNYTDPRGDVIKVEGPFWWRMKVWANIAFAYIFSSAARKDITTLAKSDNVHRITTYQKDISSLPNSYADALPEGEVGYLPGEGKIDPLLADKYGIYGYDKIVGTGKGTGSLITWTPTDNTTGVDIHGNKIVPGFINLLHEIAHSVQMDKASYWLPRTEKEAFFTQYGGVNDPNEIGASLRENVYRSQLSFWIEFLLPESTPKLYPRMEYNLQDKTINILEYKLTKWF